MATRAEREREKKASLLAAAEEVFTSKGYTDATLDEIIKLADTGKGTVYRYFGNKENLFYQLVLGKHQALMEDLWALARRESCGVPERMRLLSRRWLRFLTENKVLWPVVGNEMAGMNKGVVGDRQPDGTYRQYVRWGPMPSPEKLAEMQRYQEMINEEAEPLAAVYREGVEQGLFRRSAQHQDIAYHLFFGMAMVLFLHPDPERVFRRGPEKSPRVSPEQGGPPLAMPNQNFPNKNSPLVPRTGTSGEFAYSGNLVFIEFPGNRVADGLDALDEDNQDDDRRDHDIGLETLVAVADGQVAQTTAAEGAGHGGRADEGNQGEGDAQENGVQRFRQHDLPDDLPGAGPHGLGHLDDAGIDFQHGRLNDTGHEGGARNGQGHDGRRRADGRTDDEAREGDDGHHEDNERNGPDGVDDGAEDVVDRRVRQNVVLPRDSQDDAQGNAEQAGDGDGHDDHVEGFPEGRSK